MAGWQEFIFGWGGPTDGTLDLDVGDAIAGGEEIFVGEVSNDVGGGAFEWPLVIHRRIEPKVISKTELILQLGAGDAIASGEEIEIVTEAAPVIVHSESIETTPGDALADGEPIEIEGEHRGIFVVAGPTIRVIRKPELVRFRIDAHGALHDVDCGTFVGENEPRRPLCRGCVKRNASRTQFRIDSRGIVHDGSCVMLGGDGSGDHCAACAAVRKEVA